MRGLPLMIGAGVAFVLVTILGMSSFYEVDEGERGIMLTNGAYSGIAEQGLNFKKPFIDSYVIISLRSQKAEYGEMEAYSSDQQPAHLRVTVVYEPEPSKILEIYQRYGTVAKMESQIIDSKVFEQTKDIFGKFTAERAVKERKELNEEVAKAIHTAIAATGAPLIVKNVQIENTKFSNAYMASIEERMIASVDADKAEQTKRKQTIDAQIAVVQANGRADSRRAEASAEADAIRVKGSAEADAIKARAQALGTNPLLVLLTQAERWDGVLPKTMLPGGSVPMLNLSQEK